MYILTACAVKYMAVQLSISCRCALFEGHIQPHANCLEMYRGSMSWVWGFVMGFPENLVAKLEEIFEEHSVFLMIWSRAGP